MVLCTLDIGSLLAGRRPSRSDTFLEFGRISIAHDEKLTLECTPDERAYIKMLAARAHMTMSDFVLNYIRGDLPKKTPNKETLEAMKEIDEGGGIECDSIDDFWKKMGIDRSA